MPKPMMRFFERRKAAYQAFVEKLERQPSWLDREGCRRLFEGHCRRYDPSAMTSESRCTHSSASHQVRLSRTSFCAAAVYNPPDAPDAPSHRTISANTPQPRYSRVYAA